MALCGRGIGVERDEGVGGQACCWYGDMESTGEVCGNVSVRLEMCRQRGQGRLCMSTTAAADLKVGHDGRSGGSETAQAWRLGEKLRGAQMRADQYAGAWAGTLVLVDNAGGRSESLDLRSFSFWIQQN